MAHRDCRAAVTFRVKEPRDSGRTGSLSRFKIPGPAAPAVQGHWQVPALGKTVHRGPGSLRLAAFTALPVIPSHGPRGLSERNQAAGEEGGGGGGGCQ